MKRKEFIEKWEKYFYLGDGLYAQFDGYHIILKAERENGIHWIGLEPEVFKNLISYQKELYEDANKIEN